MHVTGVPGTAWRRREEQRLSALRVQNLTTTLITKAQCRRKTRQISAAQRSSFAFKEMLTQLLCFPVKLREVITLGMNNDSCNMMKTLMA